MTKSVLCGIISMLINRRHKIRLLIELQFCPTSSEKSTCDRKCFFQFYSPPGEWYCYAVVFGLRRVIFAARVWAANRISLQPQGAISLLRKQKYHADEVSISLKCFCTSCNSVLCGHIGATILYPNTKVLVNQGLFVFLGVKNNPLSTLHLFLHLLDLNQRLYRIIED